MRFKDVFSIIGPAMIGPSSSHTAGAVRIGRTARLLFGEQPDKATILLYGSFAATYRGHGTDTALVGGLLGMETDDPRLPDGLLLAESAGMAVDFVQGKGLHPHPNTAEIRLSAKNDSRKLTLIGTSIGGGNVEIVEIDGFRTKMTCLYPTLVILHLDMPGVIAEVTRSLVSNQVNIGFMTVDRKNRNGEALMVLELDSVVPANVISEITSLSGIKNVMLVDLTTPMEEPE